MPPTHSQPAACPLPLQNSLVIDSETESESELESQPDKEEHYIENQLGLPEYQRGNIRSSPPPGNADISNDLNINTYRVLVSANDENGSEVMNTGIVFLLGDKKATKIDVKLGDSHRSNLNININIEQEPFKGKKHEREIEGDEGTTNIHVQVKKTRK